MSKQFFEKSRKITKNIKIDATVKSIYSQKTL